MLPEHLCATIVSSIGATQRNLKCQRDLPHSHVVGDQFAIARHWISFLAPPIDGPMDVRFDTWQDSAKVQPPIAPITETIGLCTCSSPQQWRWDRIIDRCGRSGFVRSEYAISVIFFS